MRISELLGESHPFNGYMIRPVLDVLNKVRARIARINEIIAEQNVSRAKSQEEKIRKKIRMAILNEEKFKVKTPTKFRLLNKELKRAIECTNQANRNLFEAKLRRWRVFFSFHFQNDICRVDEIRKLWKTRVSQTTRHNEFDTVGVIDASIWENKKKTGDQNLKAFITQRIRNTSVTCILVGSDTYKRKWVRYEIARSVIKGSALLVIHISKMKDKNGHTSKKGRNPLDFMGTRECSNGRIVLYEKCGGRWMPYRKYSNQVRWYPPHSKNEYPLSKYAKEYCYTKHNGEKNLGKWILEAANMNKLDKPV